MDRNSDMMAPGAGKLAAARQPGRGATIWLVAAAVAFLTIQYLTAPAHAALTIGATGAQPADGSDFIRITGTDFKGHISYSDLIVEVGAVRLEKTGGPASVDYVAIGLSLHRGRRDIVRIWKEELRGTLTDARPSAILPGLVFLVPNLRAECRRGDCAVKLLVRLGRGGASREVSAELEALPMAETPAVTRREPARAPIGPPTSWPAHFAHALRAFREKQYDEARRLLSETLAFIEKTRGPSDPAAARVQYQQSLLHERLKRYQPQEQALLAALAILEKYPDPRVQRDVGRAGGPLDKEIVARRLADFYWDRRRYADAYAYYDRAYRHVADVRLTDTERNRRLARNSAGRMAGACTQKDWQVADQAMAELKQRIQSVDAVTRRQLEYWIRTGEPRLKARKC